MLFIYIDPVFIKTFEFESIFVFLGSGIAESHKTDSKYILFIGKIDMIDKAERPGKRSIGS